jgi:hypothetical protein
MALSCIGRGARAQEIQYSRRSGELFLAARARDGDEIHGTVGRVGHTAALYWGCASAPTAPEDLRREEGKIKMTMPVCV